MSGSFRSYKKIDSLIGSEKDTLSNIRKVES
jgi:hypothetical protein